MAENDAKGSSRKKRQDGIVNFESLGLEMGNKPPQAIDFEEAILGALLVEPDCVDEVMEDLPGDNCFYSEKNRMVYRAIKKLYNAHNPIDLYTVSDQLRKDKNLEAVGGPVFLADLSAKVSAAANTEYHTKIVKQKFIQRELITASLKILKESFDESANVDELMDNAQTEIFKAVQSNSSKEAQDIGSVITRTLSDLEKHMNDEGGLSGVPSGFVTLDSITLGWQPSDLIILAARPSVGKTAFALNVARNAAVDHNIPTAIFSLEMPAVQLAKRMMVSETGIDSKKIKGGTKIEPAEWIQLEEQIKKLTAAPLYIDDTPSLPVMEFRSKVKRLVKQKQVKLIVVDYLQLMQGPVELRGFREQEVAAISRTLKATAKEHNIPIIALSQLSRNAVQRQGSNNKPQLSDLRESGSIEQDADMVLFIHRLDYQGLGDPNAEKGSTELIIAKHRNGEIGEVPLIFRDSLAKFEDAASARDFLSGAEMPSRMNSDSFDDDRSFSAFGGDDFSGNPDF